MLGTSIIVSPYSPLRINFLPLEGEGPGEFKDPRGLAVDVSGVVYVCDHDNNRIQLFSSLLCIYIVIVSLMSVHTCIILVLMYLHCYGEFNVSPHIYIVIVSLMSVHTSLYIVSLIWTLFHQIFGVYDTIIIVDTLFNQLC